MKNAVATPAAAANAAIIRKNFALSMPVQSPPSQPAIRLPMKLVASQSPIISVKFSTASCGAHAPTAQRTLGPGKDVDGELEHRPGIREQTDPNPVGHGRSIGLARIIMLRPMCDRLRSKTRWISCRITCDHDELPIDSTQPLRGKQLGEFPRRKAMAIWRRGYHSGARAPGV